MSEIDLYIDEIPTRILDHQDVSLCSALFARNEFFSRPIARSHPTARKCLKEVYDGDQGSYQYFYARAEIVRERLAIQGYTRSQIAAMWEKAREDYVEHLASVFEPDPVFLEISFDDWKATIQARARAMFEGGDVPHPGIRLEEIGQWGPFWDPIAQLALQLDALQPASVWVDISNAFHEHGFDPSLSLLENLEAEAMPYGADVTDSAAIIVLTEGKTDQRLISAAMEAFFPEYAEAYQFMEFDEFRVEGGASPLVKMVKAFAGIGIRGRILAIFDNDAAGAEALMALNAIKLPKNLRAMMLPDLKLAEGYPTEGPEGLRRMDINGRACAIELYLGRDSLLDEEGRLRPVRWTQFVERVKRYQGEVVGKALVADKFLQSLDSSPKALRRRYPEMAILLRTIFHAFKE